MVGQVLTPGEKIKKIRKDFKIKQIELTDGKITRNLISLIENNKAELNDSTAEIISGCVNKICKERNIDFTITPQDLLVNNTMQADKLLDDLISCVKDNSNNSSFDFSPIIDKAEKLIKQNPNLDKIVDFYFEIGRVFSTKNNYHQAYVFYFKAYENIDLKDNKNDIIKITIELSFCCNTLLKFSQTIQIINTVFSLNLEIPPLLKYKLTLNKALAQKNINQYSDSIHTLHELDNIKLTTTHYFKVKTLEANCYSELKQFKNALKIYFDLNTDEYCTDYTQHLVILCNIIDAYIKKDNLKDAQKYLNSALNLINQPILITPEYYFIPIYQTLIQAAMHIKDYDNALIMLKSILNISEEKKFYKFEFDILNDLFFIYFERKEYSELEDLKLYFMELICNDNKAEYHNLLYKYINMYSIQNKKDDLDSLVSFAINLPTS